MTASSQCPHPSFGWSIDIFDFLDEGDTLRRIVIKGHCTVCDKAVIFRGMPHGTLWDRPTMAIDGTEVDLPVQIEGDPVDEDRQRICVSGPFAVVVDPAGGE